MFSEQALNLILRALTTYEVVDKYNTDKKRIENIRDIINRHLNISEDYKAEPTEYKDNSRCEFFNQAWTKHQTQCESRLTRLTEHKRALCYKHTQLVTKMT